MGLRCRGSEAVLSRYLEAGGNFIDTANSYTRGHSEKIIGDYFAQKKGKRDRAVLATKFFFNLFAGDLNGGGAGRKAIVAQCEECQQRTYYHSPFIAPRKTRASISDNAAIKPHGAMTASVISGNGGGWAGTGVVPGLPAALSDTGSKLGNYVVTESRGSLTINQSTPVVV